MAGNFQSHAKWIHGWESQVARKAQVERFGQSLIGAAWMWVSTLATEGATEELRKS